MINPQIKSFADNSIKNLKNKDSLWTFDPNIPSEMKDLSVKDKNNWFAWKPIKSNVKRNDLAELEKITNLTYPSLYKEFLMYKHFYNLEKINGVEFYNHNSETWYTDLLNQYEIQEPGIIIEKGFIPFGFYEGGKIACFDTNDDFKIVSVFYDSHLNEKPEITQLFADFETMINSFNN